MNKYQEAHGRLMSRAYRYTNPEGVYVDLEVLGELIDKATPKKIKETDSFFLCPSCNQILETKYEGMCIDCLRKRHYCPNCGQALLWDGDE